MPFDTTVAGDVFQHKLDQYFGKLKNVIVIADNIMIWARGQSTVTMTKDLQHCLIQLGSAMYA